MNFRLFSNGKSVSDAFLLKKFSTEEIGIFESLRTYQGKIFRLEEHLNRFEESAKISGVEIDIAKVRKELLKSLENLPKNGDDYFLRVTWWNFGIYVMAGQRKHPVHLYQEGVVLKTSPVKRSLHQAVPSSAKTTDYSNAVMATLEPKSEEVYEWIFLDAQGFITEVRIGNLFMVKKRQLLTPPTTGILNGVTRRFVIECAEVISIPVQEVPLTRHEVYNADEAFLTNTSWEILPVRMLDGRRIGPKIPGPLTLKLQQIFKKKALQECR